MLGQRRVDDESNEITAIPKLLAALELSGTVVAIDAMGCQRAIAEKIVAKEADYILAVKENQQLLLEDMRDSFQMLAVDTAAEEIDCGHVRVERRHCAVACDLTLLDKSGDWAGLRSLVRIETERFHKATGKTEQETRYYITSLPPEATRLNQLIRQHWGIENPPRRTLRARRGFRRRPEPQTRRKRVQNFSLLNRIASTCSSKKPHSNEASRQNVSKPPGTLLICSNYSEFDMRRP